MYTVMTLTIQYSDAYTGTPATVTTTWTLSPLTPNGPQDPSRDQMNMQHDGEHILYSCAIIDSTQFYTTLVISGTLST